MLPPSLISLLLTSSPKSSPPFSAEVEPTKDETAKVPATEVTAEVPPDKVPAAEVPAAEAPAAEAPATEVPSDEVPAVKVPATEVPAEVPPIGVPPTEVPIEVLAAECECIDMSRFRNFYDYSLTIMIVVSIVCSQTCNEQGFVNQFFGQERFMSQSFGFCQGLLWELHHRILWVLPLTDPNPLPYGR